MISDQVRELFFRGCVLIALVALLFLGLTKCTRVRIFTLGYRVGECLVNNDHEMDEHPLTWKVLGVGTYQYRLISVDEDQYVGAYNKRHINVISHLVECPASK